MPATAAVWILAIPTACSGSAQRASNTRCSAHTVAASRVSASPGPNPAPRRLNRPMPVAATATASQVPAAGRSRNNSHPVIGAITTRDPVKNPDIIASVNVIAQACSRNPRPSSPPRTSPFPRRALVNGGADRRTNRRITDARPNRQATKSPGGTDAAAVSTTENVTPQVTATATRAITGNAEDAVPAGPGLGERSRALSATGPPPRCAKRNRGRRPG